MQTVRKISAGGVPFRSGENGIEIALISTAKERRWQLPKGLIDEGESPTETAIREVREEAGIQCAIVNKIDSIEYWYVERHGGEPERIHKTVDFFLMKYIDGDVADHDHEVHEALWFQIDDAIEKLAFNTEKQIVVKAKVLIPE